MGATASIASRVCVLAEIKLALWTRRVTKLALRKFVSRHTPVENESYVDALHSQLCSIRI